MAGKINWIERTFEFDFPVSDYPDILKRLEAAPSRLSGAVVQLPHEKLIASVGKTWSIQEHAGHLADVEGLFLGRLDDYEAGLETLRPAEMSGKRTFAAQHNEKDINDVVAGFAAVRKEFLQRLAGYQPEVFGRAAWHPRLEKTMRLCDMMFFLAEHDDYHLAVIDEMTRTGS